MARRKGVAAPESARLAAPTHLNDAQRALWLDLVADYDGGFFAKSQVPLLLGYVEALSANIDETPARLGITVGRWKVRLDVSGEEVDGSGRATCRHRRTRKSWPSRSVDDSRPSTGSAYSRRRMAARSPVRWADCCGAKGSTART